MGTGGREPRVRRRCVELGRVETTTSRHADRSMGER